MLPIVAALLNAGLGILGNAVAAKGKDYIEDKLNVNLDNMLGSEQGRISLVKIQTDHEEFLINAALKQREAELEEDRMAYANTDSARKMQIAALQQEDKFSKRFVYYLSTGWSGFAVVYIFFITFGAIPADNVRFADTILGFVLGTVIATILNFFLGSSKQSRDKDTTIAGALKLRDGK